jgi:uncharacterized membrane-anchored protein YitT (DUF2179 family)
MAQNNNTDIKKEIHFKELTQVEQGKVQLKKTIKAYLTVILGTIIYSLGVVWILRLGGFFSGGATGASQLIVGLFEKFNPDGDVTRFMSNNLGTFILLINLPLFLLGWRGVSKQFVILTAVSIILQTLVMNIISTYTMEQVAEKLESIYGQAAASEPNMHFSTDAKAVKSEDMLLYLASIINSDSVEFHKKV